MTKTNRNVFHAAGLEEFILLKYPYYQHHTTNSMQSLSKYQQIFPITKTNNCQMCRELQNALNIQSNVEKEKLHCICHNPRFQNIPQWYNN